MGPETFLDKSGDWFKKGWEALA